MHDYEMILLYSLQALLQVALFEESSAAAPELQLSWNTIAFLLYWRLAC